jgi:5-methylcytosine-specific restriction endonuclease McrA
MVLHISEAGKAVKPGKSRSSNGGERPNSYQRRARKYYLLVKHGDGETCPCYFCGEQLTFKSLTLDRRKPGSRGGTYAKQNLLPACMRCNKRRGDKSVQAFKRVLEAETITHERE